MTVFAHCAYAESKTLRAVVLSSQAAFCAATAALTPATSAAARVAARATTLRATRAATACALREKSMH